MITREMTIEEVFSSYPEKSQKLAQEMANAGLHCVGCHAATWETIEMGMLGHGLSQKEVEDLVNRLNTIIAETQDETTITLTKKAAEKFLSILKEEGKEGWALRFGDKPGGCGGFEYILDFSKTPQEDDSIFESNGIEIHVKKGVLPRLIGSQIDYQEGLMGSGFKITNPQVRGSCSCGNSQSYETK